MLDFYTRHRRACLTIARFSDIALYDVVLNLTH